MKNTINEEMQIATLMPTGVDIRISIVDHDDNQLYQMNWTFTSKFLSDIQEETPELSRDGIIQVALLKILSYEHPLHKVDRIDKW